MSSLSDILLNKGKQNAQAKKPSLGIGPRIGPRGGRRGGGPARGGSARGGAAARTTTRANDALEPTEATQVPNGDAAPFEVTQQGISQMPSQLVTQPPPQNPPSPTQTTGFSTQQSTMQQDGSPERKADAPITVEPSPPRHVTPSPQRPSPTVQDRELVTIDDSDTDADMDDVYELPPRDVLTSRNNSPLTPHSPKRELPTSPRVTVTKVQKTPSPDLPRTVVDDAEEETAIETVVDDVPSPPPIDEVEEPVFEDIQEIERPVTPPSTTKRTTRRTRRNETTEISKETVQVNEEEQKKPTTKTRSRRREKTQSNSKESEVVQEVTSPKTTKRKSRKRKRTTETSSKPKTKRTKSKQSAGEEPRASTSNANGTEIIDLDKDAGTEDAPMVINSDEEYEAPKTLRRFIYDTWNGKVMSAEAADKLRRIRDRGKEATASRTQEGNVNAYRPDWRYDVTDTEASRRDGTETREDRGADFGDLGAEDDEWANMDPDDIMENPDAIATQQSRAPADAPSGTRDEFDDMEDDELLINTVSARAPMPPRAPQGDEDLDALFDEGDMDDDDDFLTRVEAGGMMRARNLDDMENYDDYTRTEETFGDRTYVNQVTYSRRAPTKRWSSEEVTLLYDALQMFGTDFALISRFFPTRNRREIKNKFSAEEKKDPENINYLLNNPKEIDLERFMAASKAKDETLGIVRRPYVEDQDDVEEEGPQGGEEEDEWARVDESSLRVANDPPSSESEDDAEAPPNRERNGGEVDDSQLVTAAASTAPKTRAARTEDDEWADLDDDDDAALPAGALDIDLGEDEIDLGDMNF